MFSDKQIADEVMTEEAIAQFAAVDVVGTLFKPTGELIITDDGPIEAMEPIPGWHVNIRDKNDLPLDFEAFRIEPKTPSRQWF